MASYSKFFILFLCVEHFGVFSSLSKKGVSLNINRQILDKIQSCERQIAKQPNSPKTHENDQKVFFLELVKVFFSKRVICVKNGTFENAKVHLLPIENPK